MIYTGQFQTFVDHVNTMIADFITSKTGTYEALGPAYKTLDYHDLDTHLRLYRMSKKFCVPQVSSNLANNSVKDMFEYDALGLTTFNLKSRTECAYLRQQLNTARYSLLRALRSFKLDYTDFDMPSGETVVSSQGHVSIYSKLKDPSQWCVSSRCFPHFARIVYNSPGLKYAFRLHISKFGKMRRKQGEDGFTCFSRYLKHFVTITEVSRITTVPKNNETDRVILCEPMGNMIVQRCIAKSLKKFIQNYFDIDLSLAQDIHKILLQDSANATIDLSNASNSNWMCVVSWLLADTSLLTYINDARLEHCRYKDSYHYLNMMSPMGNGFTFEVMTLILLTVTRQFDSMSHVFGDDIIVDNMVAADVITSLEILGYKVNESKTFVDSPFRESCGGFYNRDHYVLSFDFWYATDIVGAIVNVNKLKYLSDVDKTFTWLYRAVCEKAPSLLLGSHLWYTSFPCGVNIYELRARVLRLDFISTANTDLSSHIIVHPKYRDKRIGMKRKSPRVDNNDRMPSIRMRKKDTPYTYRCKGKVRTLRPIRNVRGFILPHYLYCGLTAPSNRSERIIIER